MVVAKEAEHRLCVCGEGQEEQLVLRELCAW